MKNISIFKNNDKKTENSPDYRMVASWKDELGNWQNVTVASLWKGDKDNGPALKGTMLDEYTNQDGKTYPAFEIKRIDTVDKGVSSVASPDNEEDVPF